jgi:Flp pilus assembly protein TadD
MDYHRPLIYGASFSLRLLYIVAILLLLTGMLTGCRHTGIADRSRQGKEESAATQANELKAMALQRFEAGKYNDAYVAFKQAAALTAADYDIALGMARTNSKLGNDIEALDWIKRALDIQPDSGEVLELNGRTLLRLARFKEAIAVLERTVQAHPDNTVAWLNLSAAYDATKQPDKAMDAARAASKSAPDSPATYFAMGDIHLQQERFAEAERQYRLAIEKDDTHAASYLRLAALYIRQNRDLDQARAWAIRSDELDSGDGSAASAAAWVLFLQDRKVEAFKEMAKVAEGHPQNYHIWMRLGHILEDMGEKEKAQQAFDTGARFAPRGVRSAVADSKRDSQ